MIAFLLGTLSGLLQSSFFGTLAPSNWPVISGIALIVYLYRFNLRRLSYAATWWTGLTLDLLSSWPFGVWLIIMLIFDLVADRLLPAKASSIPAYVDTGLVWLGAFVIGSIQCWVNHVTWFGPSLWSAIFVALLYYVIAQATIVWRIYE